jgi:hypothetical protein
MPAITFSKESQTAFLDGSLATRVVAAAPVARGTAVHGYETAGSSGDAEVGASVIDWLQVFAGGDLEERRGAEDDDNDDLFFSHERKQARSPRRHGVRARSGGRPAAATGGLRDEMWSNG